MGFVEDHHFAARRRRRVTHHLAQFANLVDAAVGGRVNLDDIERSSRGDLLAGIANAARLRRRPVHAIQRLGQDPGRRGFSHAARAGKNVRMRHAVVANRVLQRFRDVRLSDEIRKRLRAPLACDDLVAHEKFLVVSFWF